ncbi:MAG TPA: DUF3667 domain-containing protein [Vicinamibacterales bacterium]
MAAIDGPGCLNCGEPLHGAFCAACGQRAVPADPTVKEIAGDAWHELSGYDGRIAGTFRALLRPGRLTLEYLQGRRARYVSPIRLYLIVSLIYFLVAAAAPETAGGLRVELVQPDGSPSMSAEDRAKALKDLETGPWLLRTFLRPIVEDPAAFRARIFTIVPRVFFGMLPLFAAIVALFYRRRRFPAALVFAVHVHTFAFVIFLASQLAKFSGSATFAGVVALAATVAFSIYMVKALKNVFGGTWPSTIAKSIGIGFLYLVVAGPAFFIVMIWASLL